MPTHHNTPLIGSALGVVAMLFATFLANHFGIGL